MKTFTKKFGSLVLALVMIVSVFMIPSNANKVKAATGVTVPSSVTTGVGIVDNYAIKVVVPKGYTVTKYKTNKNGLYVYRTVQKKESKGYTTFYLGLYANKEYKKSSKAKVTFKITDTDDESKKYTVSVLATNDSPFKKVTFKGKSLLSDSKLATLGNDSFTLSSAYTSSLVDNDASNTIYGTATEEDELGYFVSTKSYITNYTKGVFKVKMRSGYKLVSIKVGTFGSNSTYSTGFTSNKLTFTEISNNKKVTLSNKTFYYDGTETNGNKFVYMQAPTVFRVTYLNKNNNQTYTQDFILNRLVRGNNEDD